MSPAASMMSANRSASFVVAPTRHVARSRPRRSSWSDTDRLGGHPLDEPVAHRVDRRLGAVGDAELLEDRGHVALDRLGREDELFGDLAIAHALRDERQDLALALREIAGRGGHGALRLHLAQHALQHLRLDERTAGRDLADRVDELFAGYVLQEIPRGARAHRLAEIGRV